MASPTSIEVITNDIEYSRYEADRSVITASVTLTGGGTYTNEQVTVELVKARRSRDVAVAQATLTFNGAAPQSQDVDFDIKAIVDADLFNLVRRGQYFIRATSVSNPLVTGASEDFAVRIMTVSKFRENYLFGLRLMSTDIKFVKQQPISITGVEIIEVPKTSSSGFGTLTHNYVSTPTVKHYLSWKGGPQVLISAPGKYILKAGSTTPGGLCASSTSGDYIVVKIKSLALLPTETIMEELLIEEKSMSDSMLADYLEKAASWMENDLLHIYLEPTYLVTERDPTTIQYADPGYNQPLFTIVDYDFIVTPLTYFPPKRGSWIAIYTPYSRILRVDSLYGALSNTRMLEIDLNWVQFTKVGGMIQLVPFNSSVAFTYLGLLWNGSLNNLAELPNFWHYAMLAGLPEVTPDLMDLMAKKAAIDILVILGAALRPGMGSVSISRDGVSQSYSLANSKYGNFSGAIQAYKDWMEEEIPRFKSKYLGLVIAVV